MRNTFPSSEGRSLAPNVDAFGWSISVFDSPAHGNRFGGDWCDAFTISGRKIALTVGDVSGHGESAAQMSEIVRTAILSAIHDGAAPSEALSIANSVACERGDGFIATAIAAILDTRLQTLSFANAGHPQLLMMTVAAQAFLGLPVGDLPLGVFRKHRAADYVVAVPSEALIVAYTDGVTEHKRDTLQGELELVEACRAAYDAPELASARTIAQQVFQNVRGRDDAAIATLRAFKAGARAQQSYFGNTL